MDKGKGPLWRGAFLLGLLALWELASRLGPWPPYLFPSPLAVAASLVRMIADGRLPAAIARSLGRLAQGYFLSVALGVPLGLLIAQLPRFRQVVRPLVMGLQALPSITWLPLAILWFGLSDAAIVFVVVMGSLLAIAIASEGAVQQMNPLLSMQARALGVEGFRYYSGVLLPGAFPGIVTGLKLGWSFAWRALMAGELLFVSGGLGQLLHVGRELLDLSQVMAVMLGIIAVGVAVDRLLFETLELRVRRRWGLLAPS